MHTCGTIQQEDVCLMVYCILTVSQFVYHPCARMTYNLHCIVPILIAVLEGTKHYIYWCIIHYMLILDNLKHTIDRGKERKKTISRTVGFVSTSFACRHTHADRQEAS